MPERLQKFIASSGVTSRRHAESLMTAGRVKVNGKKVTKLGTSIDPQVDHVTIDGIAVQPVASFRYLALYKPKGVVCTRARHPSERTVYDLLPNARDLVIAGRLDKDSEGLVLLSNDGELTNRLTHPRYEHEKEYEVHTIKPLSQEAITKLTSGIRLDEGKAVVDRLTVVQPGTYRIVIHQGWKRQIRRMISAVHNDVSRLVRVRLQALTLGTLKVGAWRKVERADIL